MAYFPCSVDFAKSSAEANGGYPDRATIFLPPLSNAPRNASGGIDKEFPSAWTAIATNVPCRLSSALRQGIEASQGGKVVARKSQKIYFQVAQAVGATCRIVVTSLKRYRAGDNPNDNTNWGSPTFDVIFPHVGSDDILTEVEVEERL